MSPRCQFNNIHKEGWSLQINKSIFASSVKDDSTIKNSTVFLHYSHTPLKVWFLVMYLYFVLWHGCSIRDIAWGSVVPYPRCYIFIRTVLEKISSSYAKLNGKVEDDEFYIKAGLKGRSYHDEIVKSRGRNPGRED